ncbi:MAG: class I SAM-dependent methyltransferase, partial [Candidatus Delongbacteria bacterium]|nr:class I SAM-dependent methyltransferase [Candidatus Delongbacteria bacterium]MCG2759583.1 class I SAM-dependent methyltransferase [Candidatus Delongbacteria bacterium]
MINQGLIKIFDYHQILESFFYRELEKYSDEFSKMQKDLFPEFSRKWVKDSFHQWSRQYEYPFVIDSIENLSKKDGRILDAGSGITFFPYYLKGKYPDATIECCDYDAGLEGQFNKVNERLKQKINYFTTDIRSIGKPDGYYNTIYCVSVLEHTNDYECILKELSRITSEDGYLILTFDISIDGSADISLKRAVELLNAIDKYYIQVPNKTLIEQSDLKSSETLTTNYINSYKKELLPWRYPYLMFIKSLTKGKIPKFLLRNLACYC